MTQAGEILPGTDTVSQGAEAIPELFDDASLTAIWWDTHDFMNAEQRLLMARQVYPLCKSDECRSMLKVIIADLEAFVSPKPLAEVALERLRVIVQEHPVFTGSLTCHRWAALLHDNNANPCHSPVASGLLTRCDLRA